MWYCVPDLAEIFQGSLDSDRTAMFDNITPAEPASDCPDTR
jgi:hypothetical protein